MNRASLTGAGYERLVRPLLFRSFGGDPERIHNLIIGSLAVAGKVPGLLPALGWWLRTGSDPVEVAGIKFPGRVGLAAGMDKDGRAARAWGPLGFSFAELGTVTGQAQPGNPKPRVFRLKASGGIINRMGFNNPGAAAVASTLSDLGIWRGHASYGIPIGISIGKTKVVPVEDAVADYLYSFETLAPHADYFAINVSSPNTPGLRSLQDGRALSELVETLTGRAWELAQDSYLPPVPVFVKIAPDLEWSAIDEVLEVCAEHGAAGVIATNTTLGRQNLASVDEALANEAGGLSGRPLTSRAREVVAYVCSHTDLPVMAVGGIMTVNDGLALLDAGASLVQLYTGFIYHGPALSSQIEALARKGD